MGKIDMPIENFISSIVEQVVSQLALEQQQTNHINTIVLLPSFVPNQQQLLKFLEHHQKGRIEYFSLSIQEKGQTSAFPVASSLPSPSLLLHKLFCSENLVVAAPSIGFMTNIVQLNEQSICEQAVFKALLWGKKVIFVTDFSVHQKGNTFFTQVAGLLDQLSRMDIEVTSYLTNPSAKGQGLVTEADVIALHNAGQTSIVLGAKTIITPLALDKAKELGIQIAL